MKIEDTLKEMFEYKNNNCYKCNKKTTHVFLIDKQKQQVAYTCMQHSKDFDLETETYHSLLLRYDALMNRMYPYKLVLFEEDAQKVIDNDPALKELVKTKEEYDYQERIRRLKDKGI